MTLKEQVKVGILSCLRVNRMWCEDCPYNQNENGEVRMPTECKRELWNDFDLLISDMGNTIKLLEEET